jgi:hypothetical protein
MEHKYTAGRNPQSKTLACQTFRGMVRNGKNGKKD